MIFDLRYAASVQLTLALLVVAPQLACQERPNLYVCEGCEAVHEHAFDGLSFSTRIHPDGEPGAPLILAGRVFLPDGKTPAPNVIIYAHHTNTEGIYPTRGDERGWGRRHGYLRAWVKTNTDGEYRFETIRPGSYPNRQDPAHIHLIVKEPDRQEYYIDDVVFEGDSYVDDQYRANMELRGGLGIVKLTRDAAGTFLARRDIILER